MKQAWLEGESITVQEIKDKLKRHADPVEKEKRIHWEKPYQERPKWYGVPSPTARKIASQFFQRVKKKTKKEIIQLCDDLLESGYSEERTIAFDWAFRLRKQYEESDFQLLETWLRKEHRGQGYGKKFFAFFEGFVRSKGYDSIVYYADHPAAISICRKRGWKEDFLANEKWHVFCLLLSTD